ncbi:hypothetical protein H4R34_003432 [Dimargaris verticillata]|uniref:Rhomboid-type serine protease n=1 Tax=Dimargaris verticillata TaxID=2761393 RepID=A0A9W8B260_9FUNG|nr:hypothetical protein H4R34_003432 [Dimargaris verticillata]
MDPHSAHSGYPGNSSGGPPFPEPSYGRLHDASPSPTTSSARPPLASSPSANSDQLYYRDSYPMSPLPVSSPHGHPLTDSPHQTPQSFQNNPYSPSIYTSPLANGGHIPPSSGLEAQPIMATNASYDKEGGAQKGGVLPFASGKPLADRFSPRQIFQKRRPWVVWLFSVAQIIALIVELAINTRLTGSFLETSPFNIMIGPATTTMVYTGARFVPCMRPGPYSSDPAPCLSDGDSSTLSSSSTCTWEDLCGFDGFSSDGTPNQGFRFILPIFLHAGIIHLVFNLLLQLSYGSQLEREIGWWRFGAIYILSGVGGLILGALLAPPKLASVGASGALFGLLGCQLLEIIFNWHLIERPFLELVKFIFCIGISFVLGLLPGIDNFAHIGGFGTGVFAGLIFLSNLPLNKYAFWARIVAWVVSVGLLIAFFTSGLVTFYNGSDPKEVCSWCQYLTCAAIFDSCKALYNY